MPAPTDDPFTTMGQLVVSLAAELTAERFAQLATTWDAVCAAHATVLARSEDVEDDAAARIPAGTRLRLVAWSSGHEGVEVEALPRPDDAGPHQAGMVPTVLPDGTHRWWPLPWLEHVET